MADHSEIEVLRTSIRDLLAGDLQRSPEARPIMRAPLYPQVDSAGFVELLEGTDLEFWAQWRYAPAEPRRESGSAARGSVDLTSSAAAAHTFDPGELVALHGGGARYRNLDGGTLPAGGKLRLTVEAEEPGAASIAAPGTLTALETPIAGVAVTNPSALAASDPQTDAAFRTAMRSNDDASRAARAVRRADGTLVGVTRARLDGSTVQVATATGGDVAPADLDLIPPVLAGVTDAENASETTVPVTYELEVLDASAPPTVDLEDAIATAVAAHLATVPIDGVLYADALDTAIRAALGMRIRNLRAGGPAELPLVLDDGSSALVSLTLTQPAADVPLSGGAVPVVGTVTATTTRV